MMLSVSLISAAVAAMVLDALVGEPRRWHPLVGFGRVASWLEQRCNSGVPGGVAKGACALVLLVFPVVILVALLLLLLPNWGAWLVSVVGLWLVIGMRSLGEHGRAVAKAVREQDLPAAREQVARIVSRDTQALDATGVARAATESMLENGADAVFASLFWFVVAGLPGAVLHRLVNTLDAMWGYRTARFERFGKAAARLDDVLAWVPSRLTALSYALIGGLQGRCGLALRCWRRQAPACDSPNAGPVMAAGAGALGVQLGGPAPYHGGWKDKPLLGAGRPADANSINAAIVLVQRSLGLWCVILIAGVLV